MLLLVFATSMFTSGCIMHVKENAVFTISDEEPVTFESDANMDPDGETTVVVEEKQPYQLNCTVSGTPNPTVDWYKVRILTLYSNSITSNLEDCKN